MIHPPDVIGKYAPDALVGPLGAGGGGGDDDADSDEEGGAPAAGGGGLAAPLLAKGDKGDVKANFAAWGDWRDDIEDNPGVFIINLRTWFHAVLALFWAFMFEICRTIFTTGNIKINGNREGLTRSAMFMSFFMVIHAIGNLHVFLGPDDFNGYGYFYVRLYPTGLGLPANIVEEYVALAALLHVIVGLKRTWDISLNYPVSSGKLNLAISGVLLLTFMIIHLFQFRFGETQPYMVRPPRYFINFEGILKLHLFWTDDPTIEPVPVRDIYKLEFDIFKNPVWVAYYMFSVLIFVTHGFLGWAKAVPAPAFGIPRKYHSKAILMGYCFFGFVGLCYLSFPVYTHLVAPSKGLFGEV